MEERPGEQQRSIWLRTRVSLIGRLQGESVDDSSWSEFYNMYWRAVQGYACSFGMSSGEADDIVQEVFIKLFRQLPSFDYQPRKGRFLSWVKTITRNTTYDALRRKQSRIEGQPRLELSPNGVDPLTALPDPNQATMDDRWEREWEQSLLVMALERIRTTVDEHTYQAFRLYAIEGLPAQEVVSRTGIETNTLYVTKNRLLKRVKSEVQRLRKESGEDE